MKRLTILVTCICTALSLLSGNNIVFANEAQSVIIDEFEYYTMLKNSTNEELIAAGMSEEAINEIRNFDLVSAVRSRAALPTEVLMELGYSENEITQMKNLFKRKAVTEEDVINEVRSSSLSLVVYPSYTSTNMIIYTFSFEWSSCPIVINSDMLAATWAATGSTGSPVNIAINKSSSYLTVSYQTTGNAVDMPNNSYSWDPESEYSKAQVIFDMGHNYGGGDSYWAKRGNGRLYLDAVVSGTLYEVYLKMGYGHKTITIGSPSVSFSGTGMSVSFTFTSNTISKDEYSERTRV